MNNHIPMNVASSREKCRERHSQQDWQQEPQQDWQQEPQQDWQQEPQQDWQQEPQQDWQQEPQQDWQQEPQQDWPQEPQQDWPQEPQQDWPQEPQQDWPQEPQQDWQQEPQQDWPQEPQQDWQQEPQQDWPQEEDSSPSPLGTLSKVQKTGPIDRGIVISASIAALLLIGGGVLSYIFYDKGEKLIKRANFLKSDIYALTDETALLRKKYDPVRQTAETLAQAFKETEQLQTSLEAKKKEIEKIRQEHLPTLSKLKDVQQAIDVLEERKKAPNPIHKPENHSTPSLALHPSTSPVPDLSPVGPGTVQVPEPPPIISDSHLDKQMVERGIAYLKARQTGNIASLSKMFAPRSNYMYANGKEVDNEFIMNDIQKFWDKWPIRDYRLLKVAYSGNTIELVYFYECSNYRGKTIRGYTKEIWQTSPSGQIIQWNEVLNSREAPDATAGYRSLKMNY